MDAIVAFGAQAQVVSLGLDTHDGDPVAIRRAGFHLAGEDYWEMGHVIGSKLQGKIPILFLQEGGYKVRSWNMRSQTKILKYVYSYYKIMTFFLSLLHTCPEDGCCW